MAHPFFRMVYYTLRIRLIQGGGIVAKKRSAVIELTVLAGAIVLVIWIGPGASWTTGVGTTSAAPGGSISAIGGSIGLVELLVVVAAGLAVCFAVAACVVLVMKKRDKPK